MIIKCLYCGKEKNYPPCIANKRKFCSNECKNRYNNIEVICEICGKKEIVPRNRAERYHTCSKKCNAERMKNILSSKVEIKCSNCGKMFLVKISHSGRRNYCSKKCQAEAYKTRYLGSNNPNFRGDIVGKDGYKKVFDFKVYDYGKNIKYHRYVVSKVLGLKELPNGYCVHHRDCNKLNNDENNLVLLTNSEHRWLHKQFGNATLFGYCKGEISKEKLLSWCDNKELGEKLLDLTCIKQIGVFKGGELLENPEVGNQQPSADRDVCEGSTTR